MDSDLFGNSGDDPTSSPRMAMPDRGSAAGFSVGEDPGVFSEHRPLAERLRPAVLSEYLGQQDLLGEGAPLRKLIAADRVPSMILWGPPGSGKTTLARLIAHETKRDFVTMSAVTSGVRDVRAVIDMAKTNRKFNRATILFIDEIHRFNKAQQDGFLPHVESGMITLIGATTENPSFSVIAPLLSRCRVFTLKPFGEEDQRRLLRRAEERLNQEAGPDGVRVTLHEDAVGAVAALSDGDARRALGLVEIAVSVKRASGDSSEVTVEDIRAVSQRQLMYDKSGEEHFNLISALHKTVRSSDPHGALYWLGRMLAAGEEPIYLARRMVRMAVEDVGLADPRALTVAMEALRAYQLLGSPEGDLALAHCAAYLALAPKSNAVYMAMKAVAAEIAESGTLPVPLPLRNAPTKLMKNLDYGKGYTYDHAAEGHFMPKQGLPDAIRSKAFLELSTEGEEAEMRAKLEEWDRRRAEIFEGKPPAE